MPRQILVGRRGVPSEIWRWRFVAILPSTGTARMAASTRQAESRRVRAIPAPVHSLLKPKSQCITCGVRLAAATAIVHRVATSTHRDREQGGGHAQRAHAPRGRHSAAGIASCSVPIRRGERAGQPAPTISAGFIVAAIRYPNPRAWGTSKYRGSSDRREWPGARPPPPRDALDHGEASHSGIASRDGSALRYGHTRHSVRCTAGDRTLLDARRRSTRGICAFNRWCSVCSAATASQPRWYAPRLASVRRARSSRTVIWQLLAKVENSRRST